MGTTFVGIGDRGFWMQDSILELWLRFLALHIKDPVESGSLATEIRDLWLLASRGYFMGCVPDGLEEAVSTPEGERLVRSAIHSLLDALALGEVPLNKDVLNLMGMADEFTIDIARWRFVEIGQAFLDLLDGKIETESMDSSFMPGCHFSPLTQSILPVITSVKGSPILHEETDTIESIVRDHGLGRLAASPFLLACFQFLGEGKASDELFFMPKEYPEGASGLVNILCDINQSVVPLETDEQGESFSWRILASGLRFIIIRETNIDGYYGALRPIDEDLHSSNSWFSTEYQRLRQGGKIKHLIDRLR
jgi:hypothetical protein